MIYAAVKPIEEYDVIMDGHRMGLYSSYGHNPPLLALLMLATPLPYDYEVALSDVGKTQVTVHQVESVIESLDFEIAGQSIATILRDLNPIEACTLMRLADLSTLPMVVTVYQGRYPLLFNTILGARATAWALSYKGKISTKGNLTRASFGGTKSVFDILPDDLLTHNTLRGAIKHG